MTTKVLNRDVIRIRREWVKWERLWLRYWRLPGAWAIAQIDALNEVRIQSHADGLLYVCEQVLEKKREIPEQLSLWLRASFEKDFRATMLISRKPTEIDSKRLNILPQLVYKLREVSGGDYRKLSNRLDQAYQFIPPGDKSRDEGAQRCLLHDTVIKCGNHNKRMRKYRNSSGKINERALYSLDFKISPIRYPKNIQDDVIDTIYFFSNIEHEIMITLIMPESIWPAREDMENKFMEIRKQIEESSEHKFNYNV